MPIRDLYGRQIFDSRGEPTIEVDLITEIGLARVSVPTAKIINEFEIKELRDKTSRYNGRSVFKAVKNVKEIIGPKLINSKFEVTQQNEIDQLMLVIDDTDYKTKLGANAILAVSLAVAKAAAIHLHVPLYQYIADFAGNKDIVLPVPAFNIINGGIHAGNRTFFQEFLILPIGATTFTEAMQIGTDVYYNLGLEITKRYGTESATIGDQGGYAPYAIDATMALDLIVAAIERSGYNDKIKIGIDVAASKFHKKGYYDLDFKNPKSDKKKWIKSDKLTEIYQNLVNRYPIISIEDPFFYNEWDAWTSFMRKNPKLRIIGDDLTVSNPRRIKEAFEKKACNTILMKVNQSGTLTDIIQVNRLVKGYNFDVVVGHRSGETMDGFIADLAVGLSTGCIKAGAPCRSERLAKYNQILRIEEYMGSSAKYAGEKFRKLPEKIRKPESYHQF